MLEINKNIQVQIIEKNNGNKSAAATYVFDNNDFSNSKGIKDVDEMVSIKMRHKIWQIIPAICSSMISISYGMMLGWPSPTYPSLILINTTTNTTTTPIITITMDQSAMITGFLMLGNSFGTLFSCSELIAPKHGILVDATLATIGWLAMWQAIDIYWLLASRFLIGMGHGYGIGQIKIYLNHIMFSNSNSLMMGKAVNLYVYGGMIVAFAVGPFVSFTRFSLISVAFAIALLFLAVFLPATPFDLMESGKVSEAKKLIVFLRPDANVDDVVASITRQRNHSEESSTINNSISLFGVIKNRGALRYNFFILVVLVFCQQFSGVPATLVYAQIIFDELHSPYPASYCALTYIIVYFCANIYALFTHNTNNKSFITLIISSVNVSLALIALIAVIHFDLILNEQFCWRVVTFVLLLFYLISHTVGLGNIPITMISEYFPSNSRKIVMQCFVIAHSLFALIITKIFQVLLDRFSILIAFAFCLSVSLFCTLFVILAVPKASKTTTMT